MRHGEAVSNAKQLVSSWPETFENPLTVRGAEMIKESAVYFQKLLKEQNKKLDFIFSSDLLRTKQTAEIMGKVLSVEVKFDTRLREIDFGSINGGTIIGLDIKEKRDEKLDDGRETYEDVKKRGSEFLTEIDGLYNNKNILIVSHKFNLWVLDVWAKEIILDKDMKSNLVDQGMGKGQIKELN